MITLKESDLKSPSIVAPLEKAEGKLIEEAEQKKTKILEHSPTRLKRGSLTSVPEDQHSVFNADLEKRMRGID